jgi:hypothetical protein
MLIGTANVSSASSAQEGWRVIGRATNEGSGYQLAVAAAAKRRVTTLAVRVRVTGQPNTAELHTVVTCSKDGPLGTVVLSRRDELTLAAPAMRVLRLPVPYPENCGVTAIATSKSVVVRRAGGTHSGRLTVEILARCVVQTNRTCV